MTVKGRVCKFCGRPKGCFAQRDPVTLVAYYAHPKCEMKFRSKQKGDSNGKQAA